MPSRVTKHLLGVGLVSLIGLFVFCFAAWSLITKRGGRDWFIYVVIAVIGISLLATSLRVISAAVGSLKFEKTFPLSQSGPTTIEILVPHAMQKGRGIIYFDNSARFYRGQIALFLKQNGSEVILGKVSLTAIKPSFRLSVPSWFKWFHVEEAGTTLDFWPRGSRQSFCPVIIFFNHPLAERDTILLKIDVENVLKGQGGKKPKNISDTNFVTVCLKA